MSAPRDATTSLHIRHWLLITLFFCGISVVQTWPLVLHLDDRVMAWAPDSFQVLWAMWWVKEQVIGLDNPFHTDLLFYPQGTDLYMNMTTPVNGLLSTPLQLITGNLILSHNILIISFITASGVGAYALAYHVTRDQWASLVGGMIFAFSPFVMTHINGHANISTTWPIPFFVLFVLRAHDSGRTKDAVLAGVFWALMSWNWLEFAIDSGLFLVIFVLFWGSVYRLGKREHLAGFARGAATTIAVWLPLSLPILLASLYEVWIDGISMNGGLSQTAEFYSADLEGFVTPSPLWGTGEFSNGDFGQYPTAIGGVEGTVFLGFLPLILSAIALMTLWRSERRNAVLFWGMVFAFFTIMALGPYLYVGGDKTLEVFGWQFNGVSLPFRLFKELPIVGLRRAPARMVMYAILALSVLAPLGVVAILQLVRRLRPVAGPVLSVVAAGIVLLEFWNPPVATFELNLPPIYDQIGREGGDFTVLSLPVGRITGTHQRGDIIGGGMDEYAQSIHGHAEIGGYVSRGQERDVAWLREQPGIGYLSCPLCPEFLRPEDLDQDLVQTYFNDLHIKYIVVNLKRFDEDSPTSYVIDGTADAVLVYIEDTLGFDKIAEGDGWSAYLNPRFEASGG